MKNERHVWEKELEELRWFVKQVNQYVVPGETDTQDAVLEIVREHAHLKEERELLLKVAEAARDMACTVSSSFPYGHATVDEALFVYDTWKATKTVTD